MIACVCSNLPKVCILGLDFSQEHRCVVDCKQKTLTAGNVTLYLLTCQGKMNFVRVVLVKSLCIPPFTEVDVPC